MDKILTIYDISKRTLFYDIEEINLELGDYGRVKIVNDLINLHINVEDIHTFESSNFIKPYYVKQERQDLILLSILQGESNSLDDFSVYFDVGKTTVFADIEAIRSDLYNKGITLEYNKRYIIKGPELKIRDLYLSLQSYIPFDSEGIDVKLFSFNKQFELNLSDYSLFYLTLFIKFLERRNIEDKTPTKNVSFDDKYLVNEVNFNTDSIFNSDYVSEHLYLKTYILSLSAVGHIDVSEIVNVYVNEFLKQLKYQLALNIEWDENFKTSLKNHMIASFYRIKFGFPAVNLSLNEIRIKYYYMFTHVKSIVRSLDHISIFHEMRC